MYYQAIPNMPEHRLLPLLESEQESLGSLSQTLRPPATMA